MKNVIRLSEQDLKSGSKSSWHDQYRNSAWIFVGGLPYDLTEGDVITVFSQYGEIVNINLVRDKATGKAKGFCFICFEDQKSTVLTVDNLNGIKVSGQPLSTHPSPTNDPSSFQLLGRTLRVDHVNDYKPPKDSDKIDDETRRLYVEGCAPKPQIPAELIKRETTRVAIKTDPDSDGFRVPERLPIREIKREEEDESESASRKKRKMKKEKKAKKKKSKKSKKSRRHSSDSDSSSDSD